MVVRIDAREFLFIRKNRMVGKLLGHCEAKVFPHLPDDEAREDLRATIKRHAGDYHRDVLDIAGDSTVRLNDIAVKARDDHHDHRHPDT